VEFAALPPFVAEPPAASVLAVGAVVSLFLSLGIASEYAGVPEFAFAASFAFV
jgi:hypothetical protein